MIGILNKKQQFWNILENNEVISLSESWLEDKNNNKIK